MIFSSAEDRRVRPQRLVALLTASVLLHVLLFQWADGRLGLPSLQENRPTTVTAALLPPPVVEPAPAPKPAAVRKPKVQRKRPPALAPAPAAAPMPEAVVDTAAAPSAADTDSSAEPAADVIASAAAEAAEQVTTRYTVSPPPSAELQYDVRGVLKGQNWFGNGTFRWEMSGNSYSLVAKASTSIIFTIDVLDLKSEGTLNEFGVAPVLYSEKPWRKPMINTHFRHDEKLISFSASEITYPYQGGEQDRVSVVWQLASVGRGDAAQFAPGTEIDIFVAGKRKGETWRIQVVGEEEIETPYGKLAAWHVVRAPQAGTYDERVDIWLAPQREWYPARVRYTYANGDHVDLSLSAIAATSPQ
ncbi:MAG TPA: DUF3108 domain-containing protein [Noviherbaspirillum sp.]|nr:DUF3108 domain-containing protein [Noviherbaspirillum sp.]